jgi:hypothetical protein
MAYNTGPRCPTDLHSTASRVSMERVYVRRNAPSGRREWVPIGWHCRFCDHVEIEKALSTLEATYRQVAEAASRSG